MNGKQKLLCLENRKKSNQNCMHERYILEGITIYSFSKEQKIDSKGVRRQPEKTDCLNSEQHHILEDMKKYFAKTF